MLPTLQEKLPLLPHAPTPHSRPLTPLQRSLVLLGLLSLLLLRYSSSSPPEGINELQLCPQVLPGRPKPHKADENERKVLSGTQFKRESVKRVQGMVRIATPSYDDNGPVGEDPRWETFFELAEYLEKTFPSLHTQLNLTKINIHALLYTWAGSDPSLKPIMLTAHQDVVPVEPSTLGEWTHPPFSGYWDGTYLWGRGSVDCKDTLSGLLEAVTLLLESDFAPRRTVLLAFGFDEESKGTDGAGKLGEYIEGIYGENGVALLVDEGGLGVGEFFGRSMAIPAIWEKGYVDVEVSVRMPGGHSSIPPPHTTIGILSTILHILEQHPYKPSLSSTSPILSLLQCAATHGELSPTLRKSVIAASAKGRKGERGRMRLARQYAELGREERYVVQTSQAVDVVVGGNKVNALPEVATAVINYRISVDESSKTITDRITSLVKPIAAEHNLDFDAFNVSLSRPDLQSPSGGVIRATTGQTALEPAAASPVESNAWRLLSASIKRSFSHKYPDLVVSPGISNGNSDTMHYLRLTKNIYRFSPSQPSADESIHTVNERLDFEDHLNGIWFYHELIRLADEAELE